ncbi:MAG: type II secretion system protein GspM [Pseudomonadota bacterium]
MKARLSASPLGVWWAQQAQQTRTLVLLGGGGLVVILLVLFTLVPSLKVLRLAAADHQAVDAQLDTMRNLAGQAQAIKNQPKPSQAEALKFIETSVKQRLAATAQVSVVGDRATLSLNNTKPEALAAWLTDARTNGRLLPVEAKLTRGEAGWTGQLVLNLPAPR